jgi:folylpolyglutamate synthase/dihydropteroate synthase
LPIKIKRKITKERKSKSIDLKQFNTTKQQSVELKKQVQQIEEKVDNTSKFKWLFIVLGSIILIIILIALYF